MCRTLILGAILVTTCGCGVGTPTAKSKPPGEAVVEPKPEPSTEVYDKVAPMPREVKR